jgi:hypothetical protein
VDAQHLLMPIPQKVSYGNSKFFLSNAVIVSKNFSSQDQKAIDQFILFVKQRTGVTLSKKNLESPFTGCIKRKLLSKCKTYSYKI